MQLVQAILDLPEEAALVENTDITIDPEHLKQITTEMENLLGASNTRAGTLASESAALFRAKLGSDYADFVRRINVFDYDGALEILRGRSVPPVKLHSACLEAISGAAILLVEDNIFNQEVAGEMLKHAGVKVTIANNGKEALDWLHKARFDCVLMDLQMPEMDGLEAARQIRADPDLAGISIIALSANIMQSDREQCFAAGMDDFITKPFLPEPFFVVLTKWLTGRPKSGCGNQESDNSVAVKLQESSHLNPDSSIIDFSALTKVVGDDPAMIKKFALKFLDSAEKGVAEIEAALEREDMVALAALGHRIKSAARMAGAIGFAGLCQELELGKNGGSISQKREIALRLRLLLGQINNQIGK
jgi:CheY-like chemotaxis protein